MFNDGVMQVEVIVPLRDAAALLPGCMDAIRAQSLPPTRIHLVVGPSGDGTASAAAAEAARDRRVIVHENAVGDRGSALNVAIGTLDHGTDAVAMVDAQSRLAEDYLERAVAVLYATDAAVVGGPMRPMGRGPVGSAIAAALRSSVGVGDSSFHFEAQAGDVDSVYLGIYRRSVLDDVGPYDPTLLRTEDDDMNARIRAAGGQIRLDPSIRSTYLGRQTLGSLFRQYHGYGYWKVALAAKRPDAIRPRHLVPGAFVLGLLIAAVVSILFWWPFLPVVVALYLGALSLVGLTSADVPLGSKLLFPLAAATMHFGYGLGTWQAVLAGRWRR